MFQDVPQAEQLSEKSYINNNSKKKCNGTNYGKLRYLYTFVR